MNLKKVDFLLSVFSMKQLPEAVSPEVAYPEVAFAGRSNVGKSSLINRLVGRRNLVKTSSRPGKTQSLNFFTVDQQLYLVDLPGYGFAKVSKKVRSSWDDLISDYLEKRENLACVIVIIDIRHELKPLDKDLIDWLRFHDKNFVPVYTKLDKLPRGKQLKNAALLDKGLDLNPEDRVLFSAKTGEGCASLQRILASTVENW